MVHSLIPPSHSGSRAQANDLVAALPVTLTGSRIVLNCAALALTSPSFVDELVKLLLVERDADVLEVVGASVRLQQLLKRAASNRGVPSRVTLSDGTA